MPFARWSRATCKAALRGFQPVRYWSLHQRMVRNNFANHVRAAQQHNALPEHRVADHVAVLLLQLTIDIEKILITYTTIEFRHMTACNSEDIMTSSGSIAFDEDIMHSRLQNRVNFAAHADNYSTITSSRGCRFSWKAPWRSGSTSIKWRESPLDSSRPAVNNRCNPQCTRRSAVFTNAVIFARSKQRALNHWRSTRLVYPFEKPSGAPFCLQLAPLYSHYRISGRSQQQYRMFPVKEAKQRAVSNFPPKTVVAFPQCLFSRELQHAMISASPEIL